MSPVEFKKTPCRPVDFKGQWPHYYKDGGHYGGGPSLVMFVLAAIGGGAFFVHSAGFEDYVHRVASRRG